MAKTRRRWLHALSWTALFFAAAAAGVWVAAGFGPERMRREAELALSELLGEARVGGVSLGWSRGPTLTAREIEVLDNGELLLALQRAELRLDLLRLFRGGGRFDRLLLEGADLRVRQLTDGSLRPAQIGRWIDADRRVEGEPHPLRRAGLRVLEIRGGALHLRAEQTGGKPATLALRDVDLRLELGARYQLEASARLDTAPDAGAVRVSVRGTPEAFEFKGALEDTDLALFESWRRRFVPKLPSLRGRLGGSIRGHRRADAVAIHHFSLRLATGAAEGVALPTLTAGGAASLEAGRVRFENLELAGDGVVLRGDVDLPLRPRDDAHLSASLHASDLPLATISEYATRLGREDWAEPLARIDEGRFDALNLHAERLGWGALREWLQKPTDWPEGLRADAVFHAAEFALEEGEPLRQISGRVTVAANRLTFEETRAALGERPLPTFSVEISHWPLLLEARGRETLRAVEPLLGRDAFNRWMTASHKPEPGWRGAQLEFDWIDHPALLRPLDRVSATLRPLAPGIEVDLHRGRWGGVWVSGSGELSGDAGEQRIELAVQAHDRPPTKIGDPVESGISLERDGVHWASGHAIVALRRFGNFRAREIRGPFRAKDALLMCDEVALLLEPRGRVSGRLELDFSVAEHVPLRTGFQLSDGDMASLAEDLHLPPPHTQGRIVLGATLQARLLAGEPLVASLRGPISAYARDGVVQRRVPWAFAIAAVSETFNPFRSRDSLPYKAIDGNFHFDRGELGVRSFAITGPTLRLVATGSVRLVEPHTMEVVAGLFLFRGIDKVIGSVPILSTLLLGSDENLVPAYFSLEGPWEDPKARLVPIKTFFAGPASIVVEGLPMFVRGGLDRLGRLFSLRPSGKRDRAAPERTP